MKVYEAYDLFKESVNKESRTWSQDRHKINKFIDLVGQNTEIQEAISESNLQGFFYTLDSNLNGYYYTLKKFYTFIQEKVLELPISERKVFPIEVPKDFNLDENSKKPKANYLPKGFDFYKLFNEDFYHDLHNVTASRTIKACIAVGLGASYNTGDIRAMQLGDVQLDGESIRVKNIYETESVPWIVLKGALAKYIKDYYELRMEKEKASEPDVSKRFFQKYWIGRELEVDPEITGLNSKGIVNKPSDIVPLMTYVLKYISFKDDIDPPLYPTHLYINTILHMLLQTDGKALESIIRTFGWDRTFVRESFYKYTQYREQKEFLGFHPFNLEYTNSQFESEGLISEDSVDFFPKSSSAEGPEADEDIQIIEFLNVSRRKRDTKRVRDLKIMYRNCCQICGVALVDIKGIGYSEVNHIQPLSEHRGIDREDNMIVLCPNHHTLMDMGIITLDPKDINTILHVDKNNPLHNTKLVLVKHSLSVECVQYHHDVIFTSMETQINQSTRMVNSYQS